MLARHKGQLFRQGPGGTGLSVESGKQLAVGGTDLIEAGVPQGREVGQMLSLAFGSGAWRRRNVEYERKLLMRLGQRKRGERDDNEENSDSAWLPQPMYSE